MIKFIAFIILFIVFFFALRFLLALAAGMFPLITALAVICAFMLALGAVGKGK